MRPQPEERLSTQELWDSSYRGGSKQADTPRGLKHTLRQILGEHIIALTKDYDEWLLWNVLYPRFLPAGAGRRILEIGSAPGNHLVALHRKFGLEPFGVEYAPSGAQTNRDLFASQGLDPASVLEADFFSPDFASQYREHFDVVLSRGFIEHFGDPASVVAAHVALLKRGGKLIIEVPNFRGIYYPWYLLFRRSVLKWHNFETMRFKTFRKLFPEDLLATEFCGSYGTFSLNMFMVPRNFAGRAMGILRSGPQAALNLSLRLLFPAGGAATHLLSPRHLYVGIKK